MTTIFTDAKQSINEGVRRHHQRRFIEHISDWLHICSRTSDSYKIPAELVLMLDSYHNYALSQPQSEERDVLLKSTEGFNIIAKQIRVKDL